MGEMSLKFSSGQIETQGYETALDRIISAVNFVDPGLDFFEIFVWIDFPEENFPGLLPLPATCDLAGKFQPYYHIKKGQNLFTAKLVEESYGPEAVRKSERVYGVLVKFTPRRGCMSPFRRAPREPTVAVAVARGTTIYLLPHFTALTVRHCFLDQSSNPGAAFLATIDELIPNLQMPRWTIDRMPPNGLLVDFPDEADERLRSEVFSGGVRIWPESPKLMHASDWDHLRAVALGLYREWLMESCELLTYFGNSRCGNRPIEPREAFARHPTLRDWLNNEPYRSFDPKKDTVPQKPRPAFPFEEDREAADVSSQLEHLAAGEAARMITNWNAFVSMQLRIEIARLFGIRYNPRDEEDDRRFAAFHAVLKESGFLKTLLADWGNTECIATLKEIRAGHYRPMRNSPAK